MWSGNDMSRTIMACLTLNSTPLLHIFNSWTMVKVFLSFILVSWFYPRCSCALFFGSNIQGILFSNVNWIKSDCFAPALTSVSTWWPIQGKQRCVTKNILIKKIFFFFFWKKLLMVREEEFAWCFTELSSESLLRGPRAKRHGTEFSLEEKWICVH